MDVNNGMSNLEKLENEVRKDTFPLCKITVTKNTKDFNYEIVAYQGCSNEMVDDAIMKAIYGVKGLHNELLALKQLPDSEEWKQD